MSAAATLAAQSPPAAAASSVSAAPAAEMSDRLSMTMSHRPSVGDATAEVTAVRVAVRVRPLVPKERLEQCRLCVRTVAEERQIIIGKDRAFAFDYVFGTESTQAQVYEDACAQLVQRCFQGYNATVFAYGQARDSEPEGWPQRPLRPPPSRRREAARPTPWALAARRRWQAPRWA